MFDDLMVVDHGYISRLPSTAAHGSRRLVLARVANTFQDAYSEAYQLVLKSSAGVKVSEEMSTLNISDLERRAWNSEWEGRRFTKLWEARENLELQRYKLRRNMQTMERLTLKVEEVQDLFEPRLKHEYAEDGRHRREIGMVCYKQEQNDLQEWLSLEQTAEYINQVIVRTTDSYLQTVQARQSQASNFQAIR
jgi:hypothetical protein